MSSAIAVIGPIPGSTPTTVPIRTPANANERLAGVKASAKPAPIPPNMSMAP
jgi:hypothetical protein